MAVGAGNSAGQAAMNLVGAGARVTMPLRLNEAGYVLTGPDLLRDGERPEGWPLARDPLTLETSVPGLFAAGDARSGSAKRVAAAVGEGGTAVALVALVHRQLEELLEAPPA